MLQLLFKNCWDTLVKYAALFFEIKLGYPKCPFF